MKIDESLAKAINCKQLDQLPRSQPFVLAEAVRDCIAHVLKPVGDNSHVILVCRNRADAEILLQKANHIHQKHPAYGVAVEGDSVLTGASPRLIFEDAQAHWAGRRSPALAGSLPITRS